MRFVNLPLLRWSNGRWFGVHLDWDPSVSPPIVEQIKAFPIKCWDSQAKTWWLPETFLPHVEAILAPIFGDQVPCLRKSGAMLSIRPYWLDDDPYTVLGIRQQASECVIDAAYKALSKELDPERNLGGSTEPQDRVRKAYEKIRQERGL